MLAGLTAESRLGYAFSQDESDGRDDVASLDMTERAPGRAGAKPAAEAARGSDRERHPVAGARARNPRLEGIGLICLALMLFSGLDTSAKWLTRHDIPAVQITWMRYLVAFLVVAVVFNPIRAPEAWRTKRPGLQLVRAFALFGSTIFNFLALRTLQLADTMSITFATPFLIALVAGPLLGETVGPRRWAAILVGFGGVLVVTRPGASFDPAMLWTFAAVVCYAAYAITTRMLSGVDASSSMLLLSAALPSALMIPFVPGVWVWPHDLLSWALLCNVGLLGAIGHFFLIMAYGRAPASVIAPFTYTQIVWMITLGFLVFGDVPSVSTLTGAAIVIASGLYLLFRERAGRS